MNDLPHSEESQKGGVCTFLVILVPLVLSIKTSESFLELLAHCNCVNCSENNECFSRGHCQEGYWGDNCMLHDILKLVSQIHSKVYTTNISTYINTSLVCTFIRFRHT